MNNSENLAGVYIYIYIHTSRILKEEKRVDNIYSKNIVMEKANY